jgi:protease I
MKALIITWENFQDQELVYPYYRLKEETDDVVVMSNVVGKFFGIMGSNMTSHVNVEFLNTADVGDNFFNYYLDNFDLLVLPGGVKALEKLRQDKSVIRFISEWNKRGKVIASTCHGAQLMISAKIVAGREISGYYSLEDDINNAGAKYVNAPVVVDGNIVSSPHYDHMGIWMKTAIDMVKQNAVKL